MVEWWKIGLIRLDRELGGRREGWRRMERRNLIRNLQVQTWISRVAFLEILGSEDDLYIFKIIL